MACWDFNFFYAKTASGIGLKWDGVEFKMERKREDVSNWRKNVNLLTFLDFFFDSLQNINAWSDLAEWKWKEQQWFCVVLKCDAAEPECLFDTAVSSD